MFTFKRFRRGWTALAVASALLIAAACSDDDGDLQEAGTQSEVDSSAPSTESEDTTDDTEATGSTDETDGTAIDSEAPADEPPAAPLATVEGTAPWVELEITDLRRVDNTVTLEFVVTTGPDVPIGTRPEFAAVEDQENDVPDGRTSVSGVTLVDKVNQQRHLVLRDSQGTCLCSSFEDQLPEPETRHPLSAQFPAPPDDVEEMTVEVPGFPVIDNVPLRQG